MLIIPSIYIGVEFQPVAVRIGNQQKLHPIFDPLFFGINAS
jgi:hypothetical protein